MVIELAAPVGGYEEGLEAGKKVAGKYQPPATSRIEKWRAAAEVAPIRLGGERGIEQVRAALKPVTQEDLLTYAADLHQRKIAALPDLGRFPELKGMDAYLDGTARGFADGAGIDVRQVFLDRYWREIIFHIAGGGSIAVDHCSEFWFPQTPNGPLLGKGWDDIMTWYTDTPFPLPTPQSGEPEVTAIPPGREGRGYRCSATVNEAGLCMDNGGGAFYEYEKERDEALFPAPVQDLVMRSCDTVLEAVEMLTRYKDYWGPCNLIVGDARCNAALIEKSKYQYAVRISSRNVLVTTYGGCDDEDMRNLCDTTTPVFKYYERRLQVMKEIVAAAEAGDGLDLDVYWKALLHHDPQAPGCTHLETRPDGVELFTFGGFAVLPREGRRFSRIIARQDGGLRYACANPAVETRYRFT